MTSQITWQYQHGGLYSYYTHIYADLYVLYKWLQYQSNAVGNESILVGTESNVKGSELNAVCTESNEEGTESNTVDSESNLVGIESNTDSS